MTTSVNKKRNIGEIIAQIIFGLMFLIFGLNGFFHFIPMAPPTGLAGEYVGGLFKSGFFFPFLKGTEVICGILLIANRYVALALLVLAPIVINILLFHVFLASEGIIMTIVLVALLGFLAWSHRKSYSAVLSANA
jgi:putative oxidoreductase